MLTRANINILLFLQAICQHQTVVADVKAHRGCWLSFGTLVNRLMVKMRRNPRMGQDMRLVIFRQQIVKVREFDGVLNKNEMSG